MTKKFTPPLAFTVPAFTAETKDVELRLARYRNPLAAGVNVFKLSDNSYVQDFPTAENSNTNVPPYPLMPDQGPNSPNVISVSYGIPGSPTAHVITTISPYVVHVYWGGHTEVVSDAEAAALTAYTAHGSGYADCLV